MSPLRFIVAHAAEAQPIIQYLDLQPIASTAQYAGYRAAHSALVICGSGAAAARQACLNGFNGEGLTTPRRGLWCNFGVAGSAEFPLGTLVQASEVVDTVQQIRWPLSPQARIHAPPLPAAIVRSVAEPETRYAESGVYDLEAAAIAELLLAHQPPHKPTYRPPHKPPRVADFVCLKLVVDSPAQPLSRLNRPQLRAMLAASQTQLTRALAALPGLAALSLLPAARNDLR